MRILITDTTWNMAILAKDLRKAGFFVSEAGDMAELMEFLRNGQQDAVIIDPDLPSGNAAEALRQVRLLKPQMPVCIHACGIDDKARLRFLSQGADDIFDGNVGRDEVMARLRAYVRRASGYASPDLRVGELCINLDTQQVRLGDMPVRLTRLEYELIEAMALRGGSLITRDEIMIQLYAWNDEPDAKIIDVYVCRIRAKLAAAGATEDIIVTSFAQGYRLNLQPREDLPTAA